VTDTQYVGRIGVNFDNLISIAMQPLVINNRLESNDPAFVDTPGDFKARKCLKFMYLNVLSLLPERDYIKIWADHADPDICIYSETWFSENCGF
jgi:hypothetical protein